jgi:hypothetical protein
MQSHWSNVFQATCAGSVFSSRPNQCLGHLIVSVTNRTPFIVPSTGVDLLSIRIHPYLQSYGAKKKFAEGYSLAAAAAAPISRAFLTLFYS